MEFYAKCSVAEYSALWKVLLFDGLSAVAREFNANADTVADNQSDHSIMPLCLVHDDMQSYEVDPHDMKINKVLHQFVAKSRQWYQEYFEEQKKKKKLFIVAFVF